MNQPYSWLLMGALAASLGGIAAAQETSVPAQSASPPATKPAPKSTAQIDAGEPRANTSGSLTPAAPASGGIPASASGPSAAPKVTAPKAGAPKVGARAAPGPNAGAVDRLNLGTATVTGDREQPKVMYIVPWKKSDIGDLSGKPMNSLLDEALAPVDRDEFKREVAYFDAVKADTPQNNAANGAAKQVEK